MVNPAFIAPQDPCSTSVTSATRRKPPPKPSHHPHHCTVIHIPVATHIDALLAAAARLGNRLQLGNQFVDLDLGILQEDLALVLTETVSGSRS